MGLDYKGTMRIKLGTKTSMHEVSCTLNETRDFEDVSTKDTTGKKRVSGDSDWNVSVEAIAANDSGATQNDFKAILDLYDAGETVAFEFTDGIVGNVAFSGNAYLQDYSAGSNNRSFVTFSYNLIGDGPLTKAVNA